MTPVVPRESKNVGLREQCQCDLSFASRSFWKDRNMLFLEQPEDYIYGGLTWMGLSHFIFVYTRQ